MGKPSWAVIILHPVVVPAFFFFFSSTFFFFFFFFLSNQRKADVTLNWFPAGPVSFAGDCSETAHLVFCGYGGFNCRHSRH